jgi:SEC-C motif domain protein
MRSRYTAYVLNLGAYLLATWHPEKRPQELDFDRTPQRWVGLKVLRREEQGPDAATVEFIAHYKASGRVQKLHEVSRFVRENGRWLYVDASD